MTWKATLAPVARVVVYGVVLLGLGHYLIYVHSATDPWDVFGEDGRIEVAQVVLLALGFLVCLLTWARRPESRPLSVLLSGFLAAVLVREHNNYFKDHVGDGVWQLVVAVVVVVTLALAWRSRRNLLPSLHALVAGPGFAWLAAGVLLVLFGQLTDEIELWDFLLGADTYPYAARRIVEECFELAGMFLFVVGLLEHRIALGARAAQDSST